jgi:hypothetical protein
MQFARKAVESNLGIDVVVTPPTPVDLACNPPTKPNRPPALHTFTLKLEEP